MPVRQCQFRGVYQVRATTPRILKTPSFWFQQLDNDCYIYINHTITPQYLAYVNKYNIQDQSFMIVAHQIR